MHHDHNHSILHFGVVFEDEIDTVMNLSRVLTVSVALCKLEIRFRHQELFSLTDALCSLLQSKL